MLTDLFLNLREFAINSKGIDTANELVPSETLNILRVAERDKLLLSFQEMLTFDDTLEFAVKAPKIGTKITQKGGRVITCDPAKTYPCGAVCRSQSKDCNNPIEGQAKTYAKFLELQGKKEGKIKVEDEKKADLKVVEVDKKPQEQTDTKKPDLKVVDGGKGVEDKEPIPKEEVKPLPDKYIPLPDKDQPFSLQESKDFNKALLNGEVTPEHIKINWERFKNSKDLIKAELNSLTKPELEKLNNSYFTRKSSKKSEIIDTIIDQLENKFVPGSLQFNPFEKGSRESAIEKAVASWDQETIDNKAEGYKKAVADRKAEISKISEAIKNPQTLEDFEIKQKYAKDKSLTPEQQKLYDELVAEKNAGQRKEKIDEKGKIEAIQNDGIKMVSRQTKHTKTGEDLHVVSLDQRVDKDTYTKLNERAKKLGGYYSSYNKNGAIAGFTFKDPDKAKEFMSLEELNKGSEKLQDKQTRGSEHLRSVASTLRDSANEKLNRDRLVNTNRRARMADSAESDARRDLFIADTMDNIADAITNGKAKYLTGINSKAQVEQLEAILKRGHHEYALDKTRNANQYQSYIRYESVVQEPITEEAVTRAEFPYPRVRVGSMRDIIKQVKSKPGLKQLSQRLEKKWEEANRKGEYGVQFKTEEDIEELRTFLSKADRHIPKNWDMKEAKAELQAYDRIRRTGITTPEELRTSLREYIDYRGTKQNADPIKQLERDLIGRKIEGYFPTPQRLAVDMAAKLDVKPGQTILEPSAGKGSLADAVRVQYGADTKIDTIEVNGTLANLLRAKGYDPKQEDFLEIKDAKYDRIIMNPPFENGQDIDHVRHAYDLLEPGGKIVAIMGEGAFSRSDRKATDFRDWLNGRGGSSEKLPEGSFKDSDNSTGVNTRLVVIEKPGKKGTDFSEFVWSRENIEYFKNYKPCTKI